jgi:hypothetical protein
VLKDQLVVSIRTDRMFVMELGVNVVVIFSPQEIFLLFDYLNRYRKFFEKGGTS